MTQSTVAQSKDTLPETDMRELQRQGHSLQAVETALSALGEFRRIDAGSGSISTIAEQLANYSLVRTEAVIAVVAASDNLSGALVAKDGEVRFLDGEQFPRPETSPIMRDQVRRRAEQETYPSVVRATSAAIYINQLIEQGNDNQVKQFVAEALPEFLAAQNTIVGVNEDVRNELDPESALSISLAGTIEALSLVNIQNTSEQLGISSSIPAGIVPGLPMLKVVLEGFVSKELQRPQYEALEPERPAVR